jgi:uncharacterized membrane protein
MATIRKSVEIAAPAAEVWSLLEDVRRLPELSESTEEVRDAPDRLTEPGQQYVQVGRLLGKTYSSTWTVKDIEPGRRIQSEGSVGPGVKYCLTQRLSEPEAGRTRLEITIDYTLPGGVLGRVADHAGVASRAEREAQQVLDGVKRVVEADVRDTRRAGEAASSGRP